jgi:hypothetical protein
MTRVQLRLMLNTRQILSSCRFWQQFAEDSGLLGCDDTLLLGEGSAMLEGSRCVRNTGNHSRNDRALHPGRQKSDLHLVVVTLVHVKISNYTCVTGHEAVLGVMQVLSEWKESSAQGLCQPECAQCTGMPDCSSAQHNCRDTSPHVAEWVPCFWNVQSSGDVTRQILWHFVHVWMNNISGVSSMGKNRNTYRFSEEKQRKDRHL